MDISEIIMHEDYNSSTVDQDFALLKMARKVNFSIFLITFKQELAH